MTSLISFQSFLFTVSGMLYWHLSSTFNKVFDFHLVCFLWNHFNWSRQWKIRISDIMFLKINGFRNNIFIFFLICLRRTIILQITPYRIHWHIESISLCKYILESSDDLIHEIGSIFLLKCLIIIIVFHTHMNNKPMIFRVAALSKSLNEMKIYSPFDFIFIQIIEILIRQ